MGEIGFIQCVGLGCLIRYIIRRIGVKTISSCLMLRCSIKY